MISLSIFDQPEVLDQPPGLCLVGLWALSGEQRQFCPKAHVSMHRRGDPEGIAAASRYEGRGSKTEEIVRTSICIPCNMPYVNNIWLPRRAAIGRRGSGGRDQSWPHG